MDKKKPLIVLIVLIAIGFTAFNYLRSNHNGLSASGSIEAVEITLSSKTIGRVLEVKVEEGAKILSGEAVALIDPREAQAAVKAAGAKYDQASDSLKRAEDLFSEGLLSEEQYQSAQSIYDLAEANLELAELNLENTEIKSPINGTVLVKAIEAGELAAIGTPIAKIANLNQVNIMVYLPEKDIGKVKLGDEVSVAVDSYPGQKFTGKVVYISDQAEFTPKTIQTKDERVTQVFGIKLLIDNPDQKLKPGMPADAEFTWNSR